MAAVEKIKQYGWRAFVIAALGAGYPYFTTMMNNLHAESMKRIELQEKSFQADSVRRNQQEAWQNNKNDEHDCKDSMLFQSIKNKCK